MKKLILAGLLLVGFAVNAATISTNIVTPGAYVLSTNRASIYQIELLSPNAATVRLYDSNGNGTYFYNITNYITAAYTNRISYTTNVTSSYVGSNGYTNWYTNAGLWSLSVSNVAATNAMSPRFVGVVPANLYNTYTVDILCPHGVAVYTTASNTTVNVSYRTGQ